MAEHGGDGFEAHTSVDGLGGQGVAQLVGVDVSDAGVAGDPVEHASDLVTIDWPVVPDDQAVDVIDPILPVSVEEFDQLGVERDVAVVAEFPDRDMPTTHRSWPPSSPDVYTTTDRPGPRASRDHCRREGEP